MGPLFFFKEKDFPIFCCDCPLLLTRKHFYVFSLVGKERDKHREITERKRERQNRKSGGKKKKGREKGEMLI